MFKNKHMAWIIRVWCTLYSSTHDDWVHYQSPEKRTKIKVNKRPISHLRWHLRNKLHVVLMDQIQNEPCIFRWAQMYCVSLTLIVSVSMWLDEYWTLYFIRKKIPCYTCTNMTDYLTYRNSWQNVHVSHQKI